MVGKRPVAAVALASACLTGDPAAAQEAQACVDQVGQLAAAFAIEGDGGEVRAAIGQEPGSRKGARLGEEQRRRIGALVQEARQAGEQGDAQGCLQRLGEVRAALRDAGIGGGQPGTADTPGTSTGSLGSSPAGVTGGGDPTGGLPSARGTGAPDTTSPAGATTTTGTTRPTTLPSTAGGGVSGGDAGSVTGGSGSASGDSSGAGP
jgi:hypothetical protein